MTGNTMQSGMDHVTKLIAADITVTVHRMQVWGIRNAWNYGALLQQLLLPHNNLQASPLSQRSMAEW